MEKVVFLQVYYGNAMISIPFLDLESLDLFTVRYENQKELINGLGRILNISLENVWDVRVYSEYVSRSNLYKYKDLEVKYKNDNFDVRYLNDSFSIYLKQDQSRINNSGIKNIKTRAMLEFNAGEKHLSDFDIDTAVRMYLANAPYRTFRKIYFMIKGMVPVKKETEKKEMVQRDLTSFSSEDEYVASLIQYASRGEEELAYAMEEISKMDLEEMRDKLQHSRYKLFDGDLRDDYILLYDIEDFEKYTDTRVEDMREYVLKNMFKGYKR